MPTTVTLSRMTDLALGTPDVGSVNFTVLHSLLHAILNKLDIGNATSEIREDDLDFLHRHLVANETLVKSSDTRIKVSNHELDTRLKPDASGRALSKDDASKKGLEKGLSGHKIADKSVTGTHVPYHQLEDRVMQLEHSWKELNALPTNYELFERTRERDSKPHPVAEMWQTMKLSKSVDANTQGISKLMSMFEDILEDTKSVKEANSEIQKKMASGEATSKDVPVMKDHLDTLQKNLTRLTERLDEFPGDDFYDSLPTWAALESYFRGFKQQLEQAIEDKNKMRRRSSSRPPEPGPTSNLRSILEELGIINDRHNGLSSRVEKLEGSLSSDCEQNDQKIKAFEKLISSDKETIEKIAGMTDRLLCRIQGLEDQICCLRQVINRLRGSDGENCTVMRTEDEVINLRNLINKLQCEVDVLRCCCRLGSPVQAPSATTRGGYLRAGAASGINGCPVGSNCTPNSNGNGCTDVYCCLPPNIEMDIQNLFCIVNELDENKMDKRQMTEELNQKASKAELDDKVSKVSFDTACEGLHSVINDILQKYLDSGEVVQNFTSGLESKLDRDELVSFRSQLESKLRCLAKRIVTLQNRCDGCDDGSDSAAGTKQSLFTKQHCLSCDRVIRRNPKESVPTIPSPPGFPMGKVMKNYTKYELDQFKNMTSCQPLAKPIDNDPFSVFRDCGGRGRSPNRQDPTPSINCDETPADVLACRDGLEADSPDQDIPITKMKVKGGYISPSTSKDRPQSAANLRSTAVAATKCTRPASACQSKTSPQNNDPPKPVNDATIKTPPVTPPPSSNELHNFVRHARDTLSRTLSHNKSEKCQGKCRANGENQAAVAKYTEPPSHARYASGKPFQLANNTGSYRPNVDGKKCTPGSTGKLCGSFQDRKPTTIAFRSTKDHYDDQLEDADEEEYTE